MIPGSLIVSPQVLIDRNRPYSTVQTINLSTANSETTTTITVPNDVLVTSMFASVTCQDADDKTYAVTEEDPNRDIYKVSLKVVGRTDFTDAPQDVFLFNRISTGAGFQGFIIPRMTDIQITVSHVSNGTSTNDPTYKFQVELNGYTVVATNDINEQRFHGGGR